MSQYRCGTNKNLGQPPPGGKKTTPSGAAKVGDHNINPVATPPVQPNVRVAPAAHPTISATPPVHTSTQTAKRQLTAYAFTDSKFPRGFRVLFGVVDNTLRLQSELELDENFKVVKLSQPISLEIATLHNERTFIAVNTYPNVDVGQVIRPTFAIKAREKLKATRAPDTHDRNIDAGDLADTSAVLSASITSDEVLKNISGSRNPTPAAATITGAQLACFLKQPPLANEHRSALINRALVPSTMQEHQRMLTQLFEMPLKFRHLPIPLAIPAMLWDKYVDLCWTPTTLFKYMCTVQGALRLLPIYRQNAPSIQLSSDTNWLLALKGARHMAVEHIPNQPKAATIHQINTALESASGTFKEHQRALIMLGWLTASRLGCIRQLKGEDITFDPTTKALLIKFRRGKGVRARQQAYTVTTLIATNSWWDELNKYVDSRKDGFLFPKTMADSTITKPLKAAGIEQRSIRRGSLQTMAAIPNVTDETLMNFSGHASVKTLHRYLNFGEKSARIATNSLEAAKALWKEDLLKDEWWDIGHVAPVSSTS